MKFRYKVGALLFLLALITYLDRFCISVAGPRIQQYLRIGPQQWGWVVGVFAYGVFSLTRRLRIVGHSELIAKTVAPRCRETTQ